MFPIFHYKSIKLLKKFEEINYYYYYYYYYYNTEYSNWIMLIQTLWVLLFIRYINANQVIIECPLNGQYHDRRDMIITSRMAVSNNFITVTIIGFTRCFLYRSPRRIDCKEGGQCLALAVGFAQDTNAEFCNIPY